MDDPIAEIRNRFENYPGARTEEGDSWIRFLPSSPEGFVIEFRMGQGEYIVAFEGWHARFHDLDESLNCFAFGLSNECRLKIVSRGGKPYRWTVEHYCDGEWIPESETGLLLFQFWRSPRVTYRQNMLIKSVQYDTVSPITNRVKTPPVNSASTWDSTSK